MTSQIDPTKPFDFIPASKADLRSNLQTAKIEIEALQSGKSDLGHSHTLADIGDAGALAGKSTVAADDIGPGAVTAAKLGDGAVTTAKLADAAITLAKLGAGTAGRLLGYGALGNPAEVAQGPGGGLDADTLDGQQAAAFAPAMHNHSLADISGAGALAGKHTVAAADIDGDAVTTASIASSAVTGAKIAGSAITGSKLASAAVSSSKIADQAVTGAKIADDAVSLAKLAHGTADRLVGFDASGTPAEITAGSHVTIAGGAIAVVPGTLTDLPDTPDGYLAQGGRFLRANASETAVEFALIDADALADGAVATAKLADNAVSSTKIAANAVGNPSIAAAAVTGNKIADGAVTTAKLADAAVTAAKIDAGAVDGGKLVAAAVTAPKLADAAVTAPKLADAAVTARKLAAGFLDPVEDAGNYSSTPFTVADAYNVHRFFIGAQNQIVEFPAGLSSDPAAHGRFTAPPANSLTLRRAAGSGVSISGVASDAYTWVVPAGGTVEWQVRATNTIELRGNTTAEQLLTGPVDANDQVLRRPELKDVAEAYADLGSKSGAASFDYTAGGWQKCVASGNITSVAVSNPPAAGRVGALTLEIHQDGTGNRTIAWGAAFRFPGGTAATLSTAANAVDIFTLITRNGGTTWYVFEGGKGFAG